MKIKIESIYKYIFIIFLSSLYVNNELRKYFEVLFYIVFIIYFIKKRKNLTPYIIWNIFFVGFSFFSFAWASDTDKVMLESRIVLQWALMGNLTIAYIDNEKKLLDFLKYLVFAGSVLVITLVYSIPITSWLSGRLGSNIMGLNANIIGLNLAISSIASFYLAKFKMNKKYWFTFLIFALITFLTGSRKAIVLLIFSNIILVYLNSKNITKRFKTIFIGLVVIASTYLVIMNFGPLYSIVGFRIQSLISSVIGPEITDVSTSLRANMINEGIKLIKNKPIFGYGMGNYSFVSGLGAYSHNNYIEMLVGVGVVGTCIYYSMYIYIISKLARMRKNSISNVFLVLIVSLIILEYGFVSYREPVFQLILAVSYAVIRIYKAKRRRGVDTIESN